MAVYTPAQLLAVNSVSSATTATASVSTSVAQTGIARTIQVQAPTTARLFTASIGADTATSRIFSTTALAASVAAIYNGWWVTSAGNASAMQLIQDTTSANSVIGSISGYFFT